jgi:hypothetical protein
MSNPLNRAKYYRDLVNHHRRLASTDCSREARNYHLYMAKNFTTLAAVAGSAESMNSDWLVGRSELMDGVSRRAAYR